MRVAVKLTVVYDEAVSSHLDIASALEQEIQSQISRGLLTGGENDFGAVVDDYKLEVNPLYDDRPVL
jgi:hypothetical protein